MMATFTWVPSYASAVETTPRLKLVQMGDGYIQRTSDGINASREKWTLVFKNISDQDYSDINGFLKGNIGYSFDWKPPGESSTRKFLVQDAWKRDFVSYNVNNLSVTFIQVFE
jgi:phage-related protein